MDKLKSYVLSKASFLFPDKDTFSKLPSRFKQKTDQGKREGLISLYKDMESCSGYADIQVMWEMIHSSSRRTRKARRGKNTKTALSLRRFCSGQS